MAATRFAIGAVLKFLPIQPRNAHLDASESRAPTRLPCKLSKLRFGVSKSSHGITSLRFITRFIIFSDSDWVTVLERLFEVRLGTVTFSNENGSLHGPTRSQPEWPTQARRI